MTRSKVVIGVTGGSGSGKTTFCDVAREMGVFVVNADDFAHNVLENEARGELVASFGTYKREELRGIVFADREKLEQLNEITHKYIIKSIEKVIEMCENNVIAIDAILLIESGMAKKCARVVAITADRDARRRRTAARDGFDTDARIVAQADDEFYRAHADFVVENNGGAEALREAAREYWRNAIESFKEEE